MIFGPRSGAWTKQVMRFAQRRPLPFIGDGSGTVYPIFVDDVVDLMLVLAKKPAADKRAFNSVYQPHPTAREYLNKYMTLVDNKTWFTIPVWLMQIIAPLADAVFYLSGNPQDIQDMVRLLINKNSYTMDNAKYLLDWQPAISIDEGIERTIPYLKEKGLL
jgi:nucleoside-diphosphate-sugar epimerase